MILQGCALLKAYSPHPGFMCHAMRGLNSSSEVILRRREERRAKAFSRTDNRLRAHRMTASTLQKGTSASHLLMMPVSSSEAREAAPVLLLSGWCSLQWSLRFTVGDDMVSVSYVC